MGLQKRSFSSGCIDALQMAIAELIYPENRLIHHSVRGSQYCSKDYVNLLIEGKIAVSMTENGVPYENAIAERVNGIMKVEFDLYGTQEGWREKMRKIRDKIHLYNHERPHANYDYLTPEQAHLRQEILKKRLNPKNYKTEKNKLFG